MKRRLLYKSQVSYGGKKIGASKRALSSEITIASLRVPELRVGTCTRRVCVQLPIIGRSCRNVNVPCPQRRTVTHRLVTYIRFPDDISQFLRNELNRCLNVAKNAMITAAVALLPVLVVNPGAGLGGVLAIGATAFFACAASIPGYALIRGQVTISVGYRREASNWVVVNRSKK